MRVDEIIEKENIQEEGINLLDRTLRKSYV